MFDDKIKQMLSRYQLNTVQDHENALKEIIQEVALLGLWRSKFYEKAVFYGGSALRILYGLDRFSEDLDFSLIKPDPGFDIKKYLNAITTELESWGFEVSITSRKKESPIKSAFIKANTLIHLLKIKADLKTQKNATIKIKLEIDQNPAIGFTTQTNYYLNPVAFSIRTMSLSSLFGGKAHALLCRSKRNNIKGRDWYDLIWYVKAGIPCDLHYLENKMVQTGHLEAGQRLSEEMLHQLLCDKADQIDFNLAKKDVEPFLKSAIQREELTLWSNTFFTDYIIQKIKAPCT
ncbi:nucleotidyl transferase AbiEii/AbiGii toxin family protein [Desulfobacter latus]|uniref:Nucleotidyl transferase AbiEii/AbiGii toxin family protein n=1 Tax=Desulfobacter latus TaxID=2292 RepID=A0A850SR57_9BACT|nr:nucleotidyl transferase AbiEii/AbiGii toxin family protein [Desulfobacter latus]NWH03649.1 nucleotidyl transferase AbiEii/AbiGii toxin family protein [Desulfobacter latus]